MSAAALRLRRRNSMRAASPSGHSDYTSHVDPAAKGGHVIAPNLRRLALLVLAAFVTCGFSYAEDPPPTTLPSTMKAIRAHESGGPEVLKYEDAAVPTP